jgi:hypothetical protein
LSQQTGGKAAHRLQLSVNKQVACEVKHDVNDNIRLNDDDLKSLQSKLVLFIGS